MNKWFRITIYYLKELEFDGNFQAYDTKAAETIMNSIIKAFCNKTIDKYSINLYEIIWINGV